MCTVPHTKYVYPCTCTDCFRKYLHYVESRETAKESTVLIERLEAEEVKKINASWNSKDCRKYGHFVKFDKRTGKIIPPLFGEIGLIYEMQENMSNENERTKREKISDDYDLIKKFEKLKVDGDWFVVYRAIVLNPNEKNPEKFRRMSYLIRFLGKDDFSTSYILTVELCELMIQLESVFYDV
jgi:hypothetical protein